VANRKSIINSKMDWAEWLETTAGVKAISTGVKKHEINRINVMNSSHT
tara:strand:- start:315 stop:458 length:144 start_codon:yes stop_codon:yes gene_type:complete